MNNTEEILMLNDWS